MCINYVFKGKNPSTIWGVYSFLPLKNVCASFPAGIFKEEEEERNGLAPKSLIKKEQPACSKCWNLLKSGGGFISELFILGYHSTSSCQHSVTTYAIETQSTQSLTNKKDRKRRRRQRRQSLECAARLALRNGTEPLFVRSFVRSFVRPPKFMSNIRRYKTTSLNAL